MTIGLDWALVAALGAALTAEGAVLHDGAEVKGRIVALKDGSVEIEGRSEPLPLYETGALIFAEVPTEKNAVEKKVVAPPQVARASRKPGALVIFRGGDEIDARVLKATGGAVTAQVAGSGLLLDAPTESLKAFRLREPHAEDDLFEADLKAPELPKKDVVYVRRGAALLRVEGVFQGLDEEFLTMEYEGQPRKLKRSLALGVVFAPVATAAASGDVPATVELLEGGSFPAFLTGIAADGVRVRLPGAPASSAQDVPRSSVAAVRFASDRVAFLSAMTPQKVEETPLLGGATSFPWKKDASSAGGPLRLGGRVYRKGLGVHARSVLEYEIGGLYRAFAATLGLEDGAGPQGNVTFRVTADGKEIYHKDLQKGSKPEPIALPVDGVKRLRLEVDFGPDGVDLGDQAAWADARLTK